VNITDLIGSYVEFLNPVFDNLKNVGIDVSKYGLDHIAYRAVTLGSYQTISNQLLKFAKRANQKTIRDRAVDMYLLDEPLSYQGRQIIYFEVLAPANGDQFAEGLEHSEFVVKDIGLHDFVAKYDQIKWNLNSIDREIGAEAGILFDNGANVKFKNQTMTEIIELEEKAKIKN
jgi:predicted metalloenzyme YecM